MHRFNVLIVDDSLSDAKLIRLWLSASPAIGGIDHVAAGREALGYLRGEAEYATRPRPRLVLLDSLLSDMEGLELLAELNTIPARDFSVVMLAGAYSSAAERRAHELGAIGYLIKPTDMDGFTALVQRIEELGVSREAPP